MLSFATPSYVVMVTILDRLGGTPLRWTGFKLNADYFSFAAEASPKLDTEGRPIPLTADEQKQRRKCVKGLSLFSFTVVPPYLTLGSAVRHRPLL